MKAGSLVELEGEGLSPIVTITGYKLRVTRGELVKAAWTAMCEHANASD